jgi:hypothetical protein
MIPPNILWSDLYCIRKGRFLMKKSIQRGISKNRLKVFHFQSGEARCEATQPPALGVRAFNGNAASKLPWILVLSLAITFGLTAQLARGQTCYESCQNSCRGLSGLITSSACVDTCARDCDKENDQPRPYGAIAYGTDHAAEGISWNKGTQAEADQAALASCSKHGNNCKIVYRFWNTCAALAVAMGSQHYEGATGDTEKNAVANATAVCQHNWGKCLTNLSTCSLTGASRPSPPPPPKAISWGAIAYSSADMGAGWSQGKSDRPSAEKEAMNTCSQHGKACVLRIAFNKQCGALAADRDFAGWGVSTDQREAQRKAIDECTKGGGTRCVLHISFCSL